MILKKFNCSAIYFGLLVLIVSVSCKSYESQTNQLLKVESSHVIDKRDVVLEPSFAEPLQNFTIKKGDNVSFKCVVDNMDYHKIVWIRGGGDSEITLAIGSELHIYNSRYSVSVQGDNVSVLNIQFASRDNAGEYSCRVYENSFGLGYGTLKSEDLKIEQKGYLSFQVNQTLMVPEQNITVHVGDEAELKCMIVNKSPYSYINWRLGEKKFSGYIGFRLKITNEDDDLISTLKISNVQFSDEGTYVCESDSEPKVQLYRHLDVYAIPKISDIRNDVAEVRDTANFHCEVSYLQDYNIIWLRERDQVILANQSKVLVDDYRVRVRMSSNNQGSTLEIHSVQKSDAGEYTCRVDLGESSIQRTGSLTVKAVPIFVEPQNMPIVQVKEGEDANLTCVVEDLEDNEIGWMLYDMRTKLAINSKVLTKDPRISVSFADSVSVLTIRDVKKSDERKYACVVYQNRYYSTEAIQLEIETQMQFAAPVQNVTVQLGKTARFLCEVENLENRTISWLLGDELIASRSEVLKEDPRVSVHVKDDRVSKLKISDVTEEDEGEYICQVDVDGDDEYPMQQSGFLQVGKLASPGIADNGVTLI